MFCSSTSYFFSIYPYNIRHFSLFTIHFLWHWTSHLRHSRLNILSGLKKKHLLFSFLQATFSLTSLTFRIVSYPLQMITYVHTPYVLQLMPQPNLKFCRMYDNWSQVWFHGSWSSQIHFLIEPNLYIQIIAFAQSAWLKWKAFLQSDQTT